MAGTYAHPICDMPRKSSHVEAQSRPSARTEVDKTRMGTTRPERQSCSGGSGVSLCGRTSSVSKPNTDPRNTKIWVTRQALVLTNQADKSAVSAGEVTWAGPVLPRDRDLRPRSDATNTRCFTVGSGSPCPPAARFRQTRHRVVDLGIPHPAQGVQNSKVYPLLHGWAIHPTPRLQDRRGE
jgi:hypothetical protein